MLSLSCYRLELPGGKEYRLLVEQVITEQTKLRARLIHQEKMAAFGLLAAGIAHDMGNPLSSMDGQLRMLDVRELPEHAKQTIDVLHEQLGRLQRTLRELVDLARRRRDEASMVSVRTVVDSALRLISHDRRMRKIKLKTHSDPETPAVFMVEDHLTQVVMNLVINSLDAMPEGGDLNVDIRAVDDEVALRIHDSGIGMDRGTLKRCKEALFTTKEPGKGTGLGLSICKDILSAVGGGLELHSAPDRGTTVVVTIPGSTSEGDHSMPILDTTAVGGRTTEGAQPGAGATSPRGGQPG